MFYLLAVFFLRVAIFVSASGVILSVVGLRRFKVGGLTFLQVGRLSLSFCVRKAVRS